MHPRPRRRGARALSGARASFALLILVGALPGCTLISVGTLVGKRFAPALGKGDKDALKRNSTSRLAGYWDAFTEAEIKAAVGANGPRGKAKPGAKKRKAPGISLVSFKAKGHRAVLVVKRGKLRFRFVCLRDKDGWKVDDVVFRMKGKTRQLSRMLQLLVAAKTVQRGLEEGSRYLLHNVSTPGFRARVVSRLRDAELKAFSDAAMPAAKRRRPPGAKRRKGPRITSEVTAGGAVVRVTRTALPAEIRLVEKDGQYWVDAVSLRLGGTWHQLGDLLTYFAPAIGLLRWVDRHVIRAEGPARPSDAALGALVRRMEGLFSTRLWRASLAWLSPADLRLLPWNVIRGALAARPRAAGAPRPRPAKGPSLGPKAITRFERKGEHLHLEVKIDGRRVGLALLQEGGRWRIDGAWLEQPGGKGRLDVDALLAAFGPVARLGATLGRLAPELALGADRGRAALAALLDAVKATSSADANRRLWSRIPAGLVKSLPLESLPEGLRAMLPRADGAPGPAAAGTNGNTNPPGPGPGPGADPARPPPARPRPARPRPVVRLPKVSVVQLDQTADHLFLHLSVAGQPVRIDLVKEPTGWKLDDVHVPVAGQTRSLKAVGGLLIPAVSLGHAVLAGDAEALRLAVTPALRRDVVDPLIKVLGPRFRTLMESIRKQALPAATKPAPATNANAGANAGAKAGAKARAGAAPKPVPRAAGRRVRQSVTRTARRLARRAARHAARRAATRALARPARRAASPRAAATSTAGATAAPSAAAKAPPPTGLAIRAFQIDEAKGQAQLTLAIGPEVTVHVRLARDAEGRWAIADVRFPLAGREVTLAQAGPVLSPLLGFGLSLLGGDLAGVRRASSASFNASVWYRLSRARFKKLVKQFSGGGKAASKGRRGKGAAKGGSGTAKPTGPAAPKFLALRIREQARWPWAQIELQVGDRKLLAALVKERGVWKVHDLQVELGGLTVSIKKLIALGL